MDASKLQIGEGVSQDGKSLGYLSKKFSSTLNNYMATKQEFLSIVKALKQFRIILLGNKIIIYTDHKNLTYPSTNYMSDRVLQQRQ